MIAQAIHPCPEVFPPSKPMRQRLVRWRGCLHLGPLRLVQSLADRLGGISGVDGSRCFSGSAHAGHQLTRPDGWCRNDKALEEPPGENPLGQRAGGCSRALDCRFSRQQAQYTYCAVSVKRSETMQITPKRCICTLWRIPLKRGHERTPSQICTTLLTLPRYSTVQKATLPV